MTIKDVAEYCGVSISTVSRVMNGHPDVREPVRAKVLAAIEKLHYVPNNSARDLVRPQTDTIGVVLRGAENPFLLSIVHSIEQAVVAADYTMVLQQIGTDDDEVTAGAELIRSKRLRGLILLGGSFDYTPERVAALDIPYVCCSYTGSFSSVDKSLYSSVSIDDYAEAYRAVQILTAQGHRRIGVVLGSVCDHSISELRYRGYCDALQAVGVEPEPSFVAECGSFEMADVYAATQQLLIRCPDMTALFTISDLMGMAAIKALHSTGRRVPQDCSVISIDGIEMTRYTVPALTTLVQPRYRMGTEAVRILVDVLEGRGTHAHVRIETTLREGESVGALSL